MTTRDRRTFGAPQPMRIFTCTPVAFNGGPDFFARDSGLVCRGLQAIGIESRAVMPLPAGTDDEPDLIRVDHACLESSSWWRALGIDAVVLYAWGHPKFRHVAAAIRKAGIFLVLNQDNGGFVSPLAGMRGWLREQWILAGQGRTPAAVMRAMINMLRGLGPGLLLTDPRRALHLRQGDLIACVSPAAAERYRRLCRAYGGTRLARRVTVLPHAVEPQFRCSGGMRKPRIVCVGRWEDEVQKRQHLMMTVLERTLTENASATAAIAGRSTPELEAWHARLTPTLRERVALAGRLDRPSLANLLDGSQVFYSASAFESFGIAAAEALCSGCSVVGNRSVSMAAFEWFTSANSGTLTDDDTPSAHARAIQRELDEWSAGRRDPLRIADHWGRLLHADQVARAIVTHVTHGLEP